MRQLAVKILQLVKEDKDPQPLMVNESFQDELAILERTGFIRSFKPEIGQSPYECYDITRKGIERLIELEASNYKRVG